MKYIFNFENRERKVQFNREKLLLSALQEPEQLYYMMGTQYEGIYQAEALERKRYYGPNSLNELRKTSSYTFLQNQRQLINEAFNLLSHQQIAVFRRGMHFYEEVPTEDIVPGDIVFMSKGDVIPADVRVIFSKDLKVNQQIYTGNGEPVYKESVYDEKKTSLLVLTDLPNICFLGTTISEGLARGVVVGTGKGTYLAHLLLM